MRRSILISSAAAVAGLATLTAAAPADAATTDSTPWQSSVQGAPAGFGAGSATGDYLWHDGSGFHLRVTHPGKERLIFTGVIHADAAMRASGYKLEKGDVVKLSHDRKTLTFEFTNYGAIDGANFVTDHATKLTVSRLHIGDHDQSTTKVYLGSAKVDPAGIPFTVVR